MVAIEVVIEVVMHVEMEVAVTMMTETSDYGLVKEVVMAVAMMIVVILKVAVTGVATRCFLH